MSPFVQLVNNICQLFFAKGANLILSITIMSLIARYLSLEWFGKYSFAMDFIFIFIPLIQFGLSQILIRQIVQRKETAAEDLFAVVTLRIFLFILSSLLIFIILISTVLDLSDMVKIAIFLTLISEFLGTFINLSSDIFVAFERMKYVPLLIITNRILMLLAVVAVIFFDWGFYGLFVASIVANLLSAIAGFYLASKKFIKLKILIEMDRLIYLLKASYLVAIVAFLIELAFRMDSFFLQALKGFQEVAFFGAPLKIVSRLLIISLAITEAMFPIFSRLAQLSTADLLKSLEKGLKILMIILLPLCVLLNLFAQEIITLIFGKKFIPSIPSLQYFMGVLLFISAIILMGNFLISMHRQKLLVIPIVLGVCINAILDIALIPHYGHLGASFGKCIAFGMAAFAVSYVISTQFGSLHIFEVVFKPMANAGLLALIVYCLKGFNPVLAIIIGVVCYGLFIFAFNMLSFNELKSFNLLLKRHSP